MTVDREHLNSLGPRINQTKSVDFACSKFEIGERSIISAWLVCGNY
jgi:hypothetical protein